MFKKMTSFGIASFPYGFVFATSYTIFRSCLNELDGTLVSRASIDFLLIFTLLGEDVNDRFGTDTVGNISNQFYQINTGTLERQSRYFQIGVVPIRDR